MTQEPLQSSLGRLILRLTCTLRAMKDARAATEQLGVEIATTPDRVSADDRKHVSLLLGMAVESLDEELGKLNAAGRRIHKGAEVLPWR